MSAPLSLLAVCLWGHCVAGTPAPGLEDAVRDLTGRLPVFPGAQGFGTATLAGRGGRLIRVTNLAAKGPGSLRKALLAKGRRTIVFEVGGIIWTHKVLAIREPYVTVAGQTAPSPGVTIAGAGISVQTHDVLIQHLRVRPGDDPRGPPGEVRDGIDVIGNPEGTLDTFNVVVDHCSVSWAIDEGVSTWYRGVRDVTFSRCIVSENLSRSRHPKGEHSKGILIGDHSRRIAIIGNLLAHNMRRNPLIKGDVSALVVNNVIYNPGRAAVHFSDPEKSGGSVASIVGNVMLSGPDTRAGLEFMGFWRFAGPGTRVYLKDNQTPSGKADPRSDEPPVWVQPLTVRSSADVRAWVLKMAGARPWDRDPVDARIIREVTAGTGKIIDSQKEVGGWPESAPVFRTLTVPPDAEGDEDQDGYTNLEEWLHRVAAHR